MRTTESVFDGIHEIVASFGATKWCACGAVYEETGFGGVRKARCPEEHTNVKR